ncbi:Alpha/beta-tubulin-N-acetyltransferase 9 [Pseudolycoriella hygida]|uniref:Alpha/beta-tubulin-N-acetyltransferase 9 n=1 Tax=Pseudolycoriella hygida TaxID=35572 RepID=A0A9Q0S146_9DIPT|nr:Alpha/beta-tubulin-N-acetyltransferase 9 [Pseudolycoriella hygida]
MKLIGSGVILIPYEEIHVEKYHKWMLNKELQELTASEPLSLEKEYAMQKSWRTDDDKCTFLVMDKEKYEKNGNEIESLIGDTNLFIDNESKSAETEIMIAESNARRKKFGWEAMLMMMKFGRNFLNCETFVAKIGFSNVKSQAMFKKMQFKEVSRSDIFQEITYERTCSKDWLEWLDTNVQFSIVEYRKVSFVHM